MLSPFVSRLALRAIGLLVLGWTGLRAWLLFLLWQDGLDLANGVFRLLLCWTTYDALCALALLAAKNWARYFTFITVALHFALFGFVFRNTLTLPVTGPMILLTAIAMVLVLASQSEER